MVFWLVHFICCHWLCVALVLICSHEISPFPNDESRHNIHHLNNFRMYHHFTMNNTNDIFSYNHCQQDSNCGMDSVCHQDRCRCFLGYTWSNASFRCRPVKCSVDDDCLDSPHTKCRSNACQCQDNYYLDWNSQTCKYSYISSLQVIERSVPIVVVFVAFLLFAAAIARCYFLRKRRIISAAASNHQLSNIDNANISTLLTENYYAYCDQIIANDTVNYPPPPAYTKEYTPKDDNSPSLQESSPPPYSENFIQST